MNILNTSNHITNLVSVTEVLEAIPINIANGYLMNRKTLGIPLRDALIQRLYSMDEGTLVINLDGIKEMTTSVAEEIGPILFREFMNYHENHQDIYLTYCNVADEMVRGLDGTFKNSAVDSNVRQNVIIFSSLNNGFFSGYQLLGQEMPTALRDILDAIYKCNEVSSSDLEKQGIKAASRKLTELTNLYPWLFRKFQKSLSKDSRAWAYFYSPIVPLSNNEVY